MAQNTETCMSVEEARQLILDPRYTIDDFVGAGAMACVYKARERGTPNIYALKILREKYYRQKGFVEIFEKEATHMRDLQYPNMVRFYKFVNEEHLAYILMDYVEGEPLTAHIRQARKDGINMPIPKIVRVMAQIARSINYLHSESYIHRDIKPGNILLAGEDQSAFLTDLGIAGAFDAQEALGGAGTPSYMPYEQQIGANVDHTVDIYAFAVMLFELFTGQKPFMPPKGLAIPEAREAMRELHKSGDIPSLLDFRAELPKEIDEIFQHALAKEPSERYQDVMDFAQDIHELLKEQLPEDLRKFEDIRPQEIKRAEAPATKTQESGDVDAQVKADKGQVVSLGLGAILIIALIVLGGIWINNQIAPKVTSSAIVELTTELNPSSSPALIATEKLTESATASARPTAIPTAYFDGQETFVVLNGAEAIGLSEDLNASVAYAVQHGGFYVPLRLNTIVPYQLEFELAQGTAADYLSYGIIFAYQNEGNYLRFYVDTVTSEWYLEELKSGEDNQIEHKQLVNDELPNSLLIKFDDTLLILGYDGQEFQRELVRSQEGTVGLWLQTEKPDAIRITNLQISLLGAEPDEANDYILAEPEAIDYVLADLQKLLETGDSTAVVQCPEFIVLYDTLGLYSTVSLRDFAPEIKDLAEQARLISSAIYSRCEIDGQSEAIDFSEDFNDYVTWENGLEKLIEEIEMNS